MKNFLNRSFFAVAFLLAINGSAFAAGYSTGIFSTSGLATSYAGSVTGIHDSSDIYFNPANSANLKNSEFIASFTHLTLDSDPDHVSGTFSGNEERDIGVDSQIPELFLAMPINEKMAFGLAVTTPFGLATSYDQGWAGRYRAVESSVATVNINPSLSYKINDQFSIGAGFQAQYYKATLTKMVLAGGNDYLGKSYGSDWGYGYNLGANYKFNDRLKFGLGYRSKIDHKIKGKTSISDIGGVGLYSNFNASIVTPESLTAGVAFKINDAIELAYDSTWTRWSRVKSLVIANHQLKTDGINLNWHDAFLNSIGANFIINDKLILRSGVAYEKDATNNLTREPRVPTGDRTWVSFGFNYKINKNWEFDGAYVHQFFKTTKVSLNDSFGTFNATYKSKVDVYSVAVKRNF
jgi:long-chain fatty acid transport protein